MAKPLALIATVVFICILAGLLFLRGRNIPGSCPSDHYNDTRFFNAEPDYTFSEHPEQATDAHKMDLARALEKYDVNESEFRILAFGEALVP